MAGVKHGSRRSKAGGKHASKQGRSMAGRKLCRGKLGRGAVWQSRAGTQLSQPHADVTSCQALKLAATESMESPNLHLQSRHGVCNEGHLGAI